ncbi:hypothetical protein B0H17DRAFT_1037852 [Mycena rosella]|uniref:Uncharacterized protein n=1 Tax=Mycena rosella TaxID=1033263 RepID=A0AAD7M8A2_MYCRO|nr:hypothetical protein B0H17DRAFT_1037852 [Mycena rosella]
MASSSAPTAPWKPLFNFRTGEEMSAEVEAAMFIHSCGSVEAGRTQYLELMRKAESGEMVVMGPKPKPVDPVTIVRFNETLSVRVWGKGMETLGQFCFDFVDSLGQPVDGPAGITVYAPPGLLHGFVTHHTDWTRKVEWPTLERQMGSISRTGEKYLVKEGANLQIVETDADGRVVCERYLMIPVRHMPIMTATMA